MVKLNYAGSREIGSTAQNRAMPVRKCWWLATLLLTLPAGSALAVSAGISQAELDAADMSAVAGQATASASADAAIWLGSPTTGDYTIQLATVYGQENCQNIDVQYPDVAVYCFESSSVKNRFFAVTGEFATASAAKLAAQEMGANDVLVNSISRILGSRCDMRVVDLAYQTYCTGMTEGIASVSDSLDRENESASDYISAPAPQALYAENGFSTVTQDIHYASGGGGKSADGHHGPRLSSEPKPFLTEKELGTRTAPLLELGGDFLGTGNIRKGFRLPTGAVWTPQLWVYGTGRSAIQQYERPFDIERTAEWTNRLDLFANLQLTGTERLLVGVTPLHRDGRFSGYNFAPDDENEGSFDEFNLDLRTFFIEGDLAEIFPDWDLEDGKKNDIGFTLGRQQVLFQDGMTINDTLDAFGLSKNNIRFEGVPWLVNWRSSFLYAWNEVNRENNQEDDDAELYAWFNQWDTLKSTIDLDLIYVDSEAENGDQFVASINFIQRLGKIGSTFRVAHSVALDEESEFAGDGTLFFGEFNYVPAHSHDNMYLNVFVALDNYTSAARDPLGGGPLGRVGLLYAASGLGTYPAPLSNRANDAIGFSAGYQFLNDKKRRQLTLEIGARESDVDDLLQYGVAARFQQALGKRFVFQVDGFAADQQSRDSSYGVRLEILVKL